MTPLAERPAPNITAAIDKATAAAVDVLVRHRITCPPTTVYQDETESWRAMMLAERRTLATHAFLLALRVYQTTLMAEMRK